MLFGSQQMITTARLTKLFYFTGFSLFLFSFPVFSSKPNRASVTNSLHFPNSFCLFVCLAVVVIRLFDFHFTMEEPLAQPDEDPVQKPQIPTKKTTTTTAATSSEAVKKVAKTVKPAAATGSVRKRLDLKTGPGSGGSGLGSTSSVMKPTLSASLKTANAVPAAARRNSTGGLPEKRQSNAGSVAGRKTSSVSGPEPVRQPVPEPRRSSLPSVVNRASSTRSSVPETRKSIPVSPASRVSKTTPTGSNVSKQESVRRSLVKPALSASSTSASRRITSTSLDSSGSSGIRRSVSKLSSPSSSRSPTVSSGLRGGSLSMSLDRSASLSGRRKVGTRTPESRDSRFVVLPQVEVKAGDDVVSTVSANLLIVHDGTRIL